jgi:chemotaxis protein CheD
MTAVADTRPDTDMATRYLKSSELFIHQNGAPPVRVMTVLGSCISVTFHHPGLGLAAMCHALLPRCPTGPGSCGACTRRYKYADCAVTGMIRRFRDRGVPGSELEAKLFGGSDMFDSGPSAHRIPSVGRMNIEAAEAVLQAASIHLKSVDVGGVDGRKIFFYPQTGEVWIKRVPSGFNRMK